MTFKMTSEEGEIAIKEILLTSQNQASQDPIPSQWTLSQRDDRSPSFPLPRRKERLYYDRNGIDSPRSEPENSLSNENDFANLEAFLNDTPKGATNCRKNAATNSDDEPTTRKSFVDGEDSGALRNVNGDVVGTYTFTATSDPMGHLLSRQSTLHPQAGASFRSRDGASDPTPRRILPSSMPSSLLDSTSRNHNSILEKSRKMAAQSKRQRTTRITSEGRSNRTLPPIERRYVIE
jgi:hypothetical protein